jgi:hypothetical protein
MFLELEYRTLQNKIPAVNYLHFTQSNLNDNLSSPKFVIGSVTSITPSINISTDCISIFTEKDPGRKKKDVCLHFLGFPGMYLCT